MTKDQITQREESSDNDENYTCKRCIQTPGLGQLNISMSMRKLVKSILIDEDNSRIDETIQVDDNQPQTNASYAIILRRQMRATHVSYVINGFTPYVWTQMLMIQPVKPVTLLLYRINS